MKKQTCSMIRLVGFSIFGCLWGLLAVSGCGTGRGEIFPERNTGLVWPHPPLKARIQYVGQVTSEDDLRREVSGFEAFGHLIFGRENIGVLARPFDITMDNKENLYIADSAGSVVHIMGLQSRKYLQFHEISKEKRLISPVGLVLVDDKIYVADSVLAGVYVFDKQGRYLIHFGSDILKRPSGIAWSEPFQELFIADSKAHVIHVFDNRGRHKRTIGETSDSSRRFNFPTQLWVDAEGKLYVSDTLNYQVQVLNPEGQLLLAVGSHGNRPGYFAHPCGIATDSFGNIYVSDKQFENIQIFNRQGEILMSFGGEGNDPGEFWLPAAIYIDQNNRIFVADSYNKRIQVFQLLEGQSP